MAVYYYQSGSLIDHVQIVTNESNGMRAYLCAAAGASSEQLRLAKLALRAADFKCVPILQNGTPALEVRGLRKKEDFLDRLAELGLVIGTPSIKAEPSDLRTAEQRLHNRSLQFAGVSYNIGDAAYLTYTIKKFIHDRRITRGLGDKTNFFNWLDIIAGVGYGIGSYALTMFGAGDQSQNAIDAANKKIYQYIRKEGMDVPDGSTLHAEMHQPDRGFFGGIRHFVTKYPSETLNSVYVGVGGLLSAAALFRATRPVQAGLVGKELVEALAERRKEWWDVGLGVVTGSSAIAGLAIKEKKPIQGEPKRGGLLGIVDWIQEKPLRATGYGYMIATLCHAYGTWLQYRRKDPLVRSTAIFRGIFVVSNLFSEALLAISSKGHGIGVKPDKSIDQTVIASTAEFILRQPKEVREAMIEKMAGYMASQEVLGGHSDVIVKDLRAHVQTLEQNPWTKHFQLPANAQKPDIRVHETANDNFKTANDNGPKTNVGNVEYVGAQQQLQTPALV